MSLRIIQYAFIFIAALLGLAVAEPKPASMTPQQQMIYQPQPEQGLWGVAAYYGRINDDLLNQLLRFQYKFQNTALYAAELNYRLAPANPLNQFFGAINAKFEVNANVTYQDDPVGPIYEFTPYFNLRWINFPWNHYLTTTLAFGEGVSYATSIPLLEKRDHNVSINGRRLENYLMFEATASLPSRPDWQIFYRLHHRSGVFGIYDSSNSGSTAVGVGIRHYFDWA